MTLPLQKPELVRLSKLLGLLGSNQDAEALAAARKADALVRSLGLTWQNIVLTRWNSRPTSTPWANTLAGKLNLVLGAPDALDAWEKNFVKSVAGKRSLSVKQMAVLDRLVLQVRAHKAARAAA